MYDHRISEPKWQAVWQSNRLFLQTERQDPPLSRDDNTSEKQPADASTAPVVARTASPIADQEKMYLLFAFAYPSGAGLHVGHVESKTALDILARYYRMNNKKVYFPVGWDAFGLPAENYAVKTGVPPAVTTKKAIDTFRRQIQRIGISYDWANEIATSHPGYYKWTQWLFIQLFNKGLAYRGNGMVNWCPSCQTVLANEQVVNGECERCGTKVVQKQMEQWFFKITKYQDELISGLDEVDWPHATKQQQLNWIGKKSGITIAYPVKDTDQTIECFTTRPDTNFGSTFVVIAPEHEFAQKIARGELVARGESTQEAVRLYIDQSMRKTELERQTEGKKKSGVFTGFVVINPLNGKELPVWISDFVLAGFGTGAVVGVPGHDLRDFQFASTFDIPITRVVIGPDGDTGEISSESQVQELSGVMINSDFLDGMPIQQAIEKMMDHLEENGWGKRVTTYKLRDWLISRQRYWGAPIPIVYDPEGTPHAVVDEALPWILPTDVDFNPTGESPLKSSAEFQTRTESYAAKYHADLIKEKGWNLQGKGWRPEYDTMDTFVDSSWYYLRYTDARNETAFADKAQLDAWMPVDFYMIGPEHIVLHLLYSRFFTKFLRDEGYLKCNEPFTKMRHQGMILGPDGKKMSKSKGNTINPDEIIESFGADTLRVYEMFMGPIDADKPWSTTAVAGVYRFLQRMHTLFVDQLQDIGESPSASGSVAIGSAEKQSAVVRKLHQSLAKITTDIPQLKFNTAIASMMEFVNEWDSRRRETSNLVERAQLLSAQDLTMVARMLAPFAPFLAEELWSLLASSVRDNVPVVVAQQAGNLPSIHQAVWPFANPLLAQPEAVLIPIQINGKVRAKLELSYDLIDEHRVVIEKALHLPEVLKYTEGKEVVKKLYIAGKILSIVLK